MVWQDAVFAIGGLALTLGVIPIIRASTPPPLLASATLVFVLSSYVVALATLGLWLATTAMVAQVAAWSVCVVQRLRLAH